MFKFLFGKSAATVQEGRTYQAKGQDNPFEPVWQAKVISVKSGQSGKRYVRFICWQAGTDMTPVERTVTEEEFLYCYG